MNDYILRRLRFSLVRIRYSDDFRFRQNCFYRFCGYAQGLVDADIISSDEYSRLIDLAASALTVDLVSAA